MTLRNQRVAARVARRPGFAAWLVVLALCLGARAARAQQQPTSWSLPDSFGWVLSRWAEPRWRSDDPDLVRAGARAMPQDALAEGARVEASVPVDLDDDGVDERVLQVAPRGDPSPQNPAPGLVLLRRQEGGWTATVLGRLPWVNDELPERDWSRTWTAFDWGRVREGGRWRLALSYTVQIVEEHRSGHGHESYPHHIALRVRLVDGELRTDVFCVRHEGEADDHLWHGVTPTCRCDRGGARDASPGPAPACGPCGPTLANDPSDGPHYYEYRSGPAPAWCRAFVADPRHRALRR